MTRPFVLCVARILLLPVIYLASGIRELPLQCGQSPHKKLLAFAFCSRSCKRDVILFG